MSIDNDKVGPDLGLPDPDSDPVFARLRLALGETGASLAPRAGWAEQVWARIDADDTANAPPAIARPAGRRRRWFAGGAALAAAAIGLLVWQPWAGAPSTPRAGGGVQVASRALAPTLTFRQGPQVMRGVTAAPGDTVVVRHDDPAIVTWVYHGEALLAEGGAALEVLLERPGTYHVITMVGGRRAPVTFDAAIASLVRDRVPHHRQPIDVR